MMGINFSILLFILSSVTLFSVQKFETNEDKKSYIFLRATPSMDRFGDYIITYIKAKWFAYKNNMPLIIPPSKNFLGLKISEAETFSLEPPKGRKVCLNSYSGSLPFGRNTYIVNFNPTLFETPDLFREIKKDRDFCKELQEMICPLEEIELVYPPEEMFSVAVHIRNGGGYDRPLLSEQIFTPDPKRKWLCSRKGPFIEKYNDSEWPSKFFPEQFFIDQIKELSKKLNHSPLYVFIFTDNLYPEQLRKRIEENVNLLNVVFVSRKIFSRSRDQLFSDYFSMPNFDCLIRSMSSHFSLTTEFLANYKIVIYPKTFHWEVDDEYKYYLVADEVLTEYSQDYGDHF